MVQYQKQDIGPLITGREIRHFFELSHPGPI